MHQTGNTANKGKTDNDTFKTKVKFIITCIAILDSKLKLRCFGVQKMYVKICKH